MVSQDIPEVLAVPIVGDESSTGLVEILSAKGVDLFDTLSGELLTKDSVVQWEKKLDTTVSEIRSLSDKETILRSYRAILSKAASSALDPVQLNTFEFLSNAFADTLLGLYPKNSPITELIDEVTDLHLDFIEVFVARIGGVDEEGYSTVERGERKEFICYQFAGLIRSMYARLSKGLGGQYNQPASVEKVRLDNWVSPVYARMQRRFIRFQAVEVDTKLREMTNEAFDRLLQRLEIQLSPRYLITGPRDDKEFEIVPDEELMSSAQLRTYPPWELANFILIVLRNAIVATEMENLETKIKFLFRESIANRMRYINLKLEDMYYSQQLVLSKDQASMVEEMLNLGHEAVAAVLSIWQVRHNIVGVVVNDAVSEIMPPPSPSSSWASPEGDTPKVRTRDYLRPVTFTGGKAGVLASIPVHMRREVLSAVNDMAEAAAAESNTGAGGKPDGALETVALLGHALRTTASDDLRALSTYNRDVSEQPKDRDAIYIATLSSVLAEALAAPRFNRQWLYENLLAFAVLEETISVRQPRAACEVSFRRALELAALRLVSRQTATADMESASITAGNSAVESIADMPERIAVVEQALCMILRMPATGLPTARMTAFKSAINRMLKGERGADRQIGQESALGRGVTVGSELVPAGTGAVGTAGGLSGLLEVQRKYKQLASLLHIEASEAERIVRPLGRERFDNAVAALLKGADVAVSMPELGSTFEQQVRL